MKYYIYKYIVNNEIVYIGQSTNLKRRISEHKIDKLKNLKATIYYFECQNRTAMNSWEYNLINKYHPKYNSALKDDNTNINIEEPKWLLYKEENFPIIKKKEEKEVNHKVANIDLGVLLNTIDYKNSQSENNIIYHFYNISLLEQKVVIYLLIKSKLYNIDLLNVEGSISEYLRFLGITTGGRLYREIKDKNSSFFNITDDNKLSLTEDGINELINFQELDIDYLANILKFIQSKWTCFILDALLQTDDYILYINELNYYLSDSYISNFNGTKKRIILPAIEEMNLMGLNFSYNPIKVGRKISYIKFII